MSKRPEDYAEERNKRLEDSLDDPLDDPFRDSQAIEDLELAIGVTQEEAERLWSRFKGTVKKMKDAVER